MTDSIFPTQDQPGGSGQDLLHVTAPTLSDDLRRYLMLLLHWAWLFVLLGAAAGAYGYWDSSRQTPQYSASATMLINESRNLNEYANILASERLAQTYSQLMIQLPVLEGVVEELGLPVSPSALKGRVSVNVVEDTQLMVVSVQDTDPVRAADIANTIGSVFTVQNQAFQASRYQDSKASLSAQLSQVDQQIQDTSSALYRLGVTGDAETDAELELTPTQLQERDRLETNLALYRQIYATLLQSYEQVRLAEIQNTSNVVLVEPASPPGSPFRPDPPRDALLAAVMGLVVAAAIVLLIELLDDTIKGPEDIARHLGLPVLGLVARIDPELQSEAPLAMQQPRAPIVEAFRSLRTNLQFASVDRPLRRILVTSPSPKDGKSTISANLAVVFAQGGRSVILVDADLRRPAIHKRFKLSNRTGLSELFMGPVDEANLPLHETTVPGLRLLTTGGLPPNPAELVGSEKMQSILAALQRQADLLVIDTPPVMAVTDSAVLAARVDGVVLVIRPGETKLAASRQAVEQLRRSNAPLLGVVLNDVENRRNRYYYYYRGYYAYAHQYYYGDSGKRRRWGRRTKKAASV